MLLSFIKLLKFFNLLDMLVGIDDEFQEEFQEDIAWNHSIKVNPQNKRLVNAITVTTHIGRA